MGKRLLTALIGIIVFFAVILSHHYVLYIAGTLITLGMLCEMYRVMDIKLPLKVTGYIASLLICSGFIVNKPMLGSTLAVVILVISIFAFHKVSDGKTILSIAFVTLAISMFMSILFLIRKYCDRFTVMIPFICAWLSDSGAYIFGSLCGKHKLCEKVSPNKTIEGAVAGVVVSTIGLIAYIYIMCGVTTGSWNVAPLAVFKFGMIGFLGSIISQIGDLCASSIKRDFGKKDYGSILPGHGGLLDRFDSVLLTIPFVFYIMVYFVL